MQLAHISMINSIWAPVHTVARYTREQHMHNRNGVTALRVLHPGGILRSSHSCRNYSGSALWRHACPVPSMVPSEWCGVLVLRARPLLDRGSVARNAAVQQQLAVLPCPVLLISLRSCHTALISFN